jgi:hypothetical protein
MFFLIFLMCAYSRFGNSCPTCLWRFENCANSENSKNAVLQLFSFELPLPTFKSLQMLWNELSATWAGQLAIISGGFGPQCMIKDLLIAQRTLHVGGDPVLLYTILVESTKQLGLLGHVDRFSGANLRGKTSGFWLEVQVCTFSIIYVINTPSSVSYQTSLIYLLDSQFMTIMIAVS